MFGGKGAGLPEPGTLFLVVGPSGVGKDSLIEAARKALADNPGFTFPTRAITRPAGAGGEGHRALSEGDFSAELAADAFALHWSAHGLRYGIPRSIEGNLARGHSVVVNVSRGVLDDARRLFSHVVVLSITTKLDALATRLKERGREDDAEIARRVARARAYRVEGPDVVVIDNSGELRAAEQAFIAAILST